MEAKSLIMISLKIMMFTLTKDIICSAPGSCFRQSTRLIGHFRIIFGLFFKASPGAHPFI